MARTPEVRAKGSYWYSEAGGRARRFGRVDQVSKAEATASLWKALAEDEAKSSVVKNATVETEAQRESREQEQESNASSRHGGAGLWVSKQEPTFNALTDAYLNWIKANRSDALFRESKRHLGRWNESLGTMPGVEVAAHHLEAFRERLLGEGHAKLYVSKHEITVKAMIARCVRLGLLPRGFKPFESVEALRIPPKALLESDLPTQAEVSALIANAKPDFRDLLKVYYATGARTHELIEARCRDYQQGSKSLILTKHKRSSTLREYRPRVITLNAEAENVIKNRCQEQSPEALIFPNRAGNAFTSCLIGDMFARLRTKANVRDHISIYSLRHLWISEMLMAGHDALLVARMAGTSVKMIESVYGHFRSQSLASAQAILDAARARRV